MLDSIYTGVTGVSSHQTRMDVISNNIANVNTTAYKGERANFTDIMSKTIHGGSPEGAEISATNPNQVGRGVGISSVDTIQGQGTLQSTGIETDLAIDGDGYFVVSDGDQKLYTRDGTFAFDTQGRLYDPGTGLLVQGNMAGADGAFNAELSDIAIPLDRESPAVATTTIRLSGNLDASGSGKEDSNWSATTSFGIPAQLSTSANPVFPLDLSASGGGIKISISDNGQITQTVLEVPSKPYTDMPELIGELNGQISINGGLKNRVQFKSNDLGQLVLRTVSGGPDVSLSIDNADPAINIVSAMGFVAADVQNGGAVSETTLLNDLANISQELTDGDVLRFSGMKPNGERFSGNFTFVQGETETVGDFLNSISNVYGGVDTEIDTQSGNLVLKETSTGDQVAGIDLQVALLDSDNNSGLFGDESPFEFSTNTQVFDEKGEPHSLTLTFTKSSIDNNWNWVAMVNSVAPQAGNNGTVTFNQDGTLANFETTDGFPITFKPDEGTSELKLEIGANSTGRLGGLTQFVASSTASVREQDGRASGTLQSVDILTDGNIVGLFSNGQSEDLARVALASFGNENGLLRQGDNMFGETEASGEATIGVAGTTVQGSINSGQVEMSNVDLANEFTNMIVTQRGFQASARSITTADELLTEVVNLKR